MGTSKPGEKGPVSVRLQASTDELRELEQLIPSNDIDSRMLRDFCGAVATTSAQLLGPYSNGSNFESGAATPIPSCLC